MEAPTAEVLDASAPRPDRENSKAALPKRPTQDAGRKPEPISPPARPAPPKPPATPTYRPAFVPPEPAAPTPKPDHAPKPDLSRVGPGAAVTHRAFGAGVVDRIEKKPTGSTHVYVRFGETMKSFGYPGAFYDGFLRLKE